MRDKPTNVRLYLENTFVMSGNVYFKSLCFPWQVFWLPACAKKVITENSEAILSHMKAPNEIYFFS